MGQRHQIFLRTENGAKIITKDNGKKMTAEQKKEFGNGDTTVLAYHHQWLYGFSAAIQALHVLEFNQDANEYNSPFRNSGIRYGGLVSRDDVKGWTNSVTALLSMFIHPLHKAFGTGRIGMERVHYLNEGEPGMRENFDAGDNNDGITIIDTLTGKYCFMVINEYQCEDNGRKPYQILSAVEYVRDFYYPVDPEKLGESEKKEYERDKEKFEKKIADRKKQYARLEREFKKFPVLTEAELSEIWPNFGERVQQNKASTVLP